MIILHVASGRLYGGIERMLSTLADSRALLRQSSFEFAVAAPGRLRDDLRAAGATVHDLGDVRIRRPRSVWQARAHLRGIIGGRRGVVVVCHAPWAYALFADVARACGARVVLWQHDAATGRGVIEWLARRTPADLVVCNSAWTASTSGALHASAPAVVIPCPVSPLTAAGLRDTVRMSLGAARDDVVILAASRVEPWKGHAELIGALRALRTLPWILWVAGEAQRPHEVEYAARLRTLVETTGLSSRVKFLGQRRDMGSLLDAADIVAQANVRPEPFGILFAEALFAGRPVVTARMGGATEILDDACARLFTPGDANDLQRALGELIRDPSLRARLGAAGPRRAHACCAPAVVIPQLEEALRSCGSPAVA